MNVFLLNTLEGGLDLYSILKDKIEIKGYIGLNEKVNKGQIAGYKKYVGSDEKYYELDSYSMLKPEDKDLLLSLDIDVLIVGGWQRLIPEWLINHVKVCCVGAHGSPLGITKGRGRSPQNWALMLGQEEFFISIFKINAGIDSGEIIASDKIVYTKQDNIRTSYIKITLKVASMIMDAYTHNLFVKKGQIQTDDNAEYLPKRTPEDGAIDWNRSSNEVVDFTRALSKPYDGAFSIQDAGKITFWHAASFELYQNAKHQSGEVILMTNNDEIIIKCKEGAVIFSEYDVNYDIKEGDILRSVDFKSQLRLICDRHRDKYPNLPLSELLLSFVN